MTAQHLRPPGLGPGTFLDCGVDRISATSCTGMFGHIRSLRSLLPTNLALFSGLLQLPISLSMDLVLTADKHVLGA